MKKLASQIKQLEYFIPHFNQSNNTVSASTVGWQLEHSLLTINRVAEQMIQSDPKSYKWTFNPGRMIILLTQKIPRGRAQAPKIVQPENIIDESSLQTNLALARQNMSIIESLPRNHYFEHPYFGKLNVKPAIQFLEIHTQHHLEIIQDIVKN